MILKNYGYHQDCEIALLLHLPGDPTLCTDFDRCNSEGTDFDAKASTFFGWKISV